MHCFMRNVVVRGVDSIHVACMLHDLLYSVTRSWLDWMTYGNPFGPEGQPHQNRILTVLSRVCITSANFRIRVGSGPDCGLAFWGISLNNFHSCRIVLVLLIHSEQQEATQLTMTAAQRSQCPAFYSLF